MSSIVELPELQDSDLSTGRWKVTIFNNHVNTVEEVVDVLMKATRCDQEEAQIETWEAHHYGKSDVHFTSRRECELVAGIISSIGVKTEVSPEWPD